MRKNSARGPEDFFDPDNFEVGAFMADFGHNFREHSSSTASGSARWAFSFKKALIAVAIILILGMLSFGIIIFSAIFLF